MISICLGFRVEERCNHWCWIITRSSVSYSCLLLSLQKRFNLLFSLYSFVFMEYGLYLRFSVFSLTGFRFCFSNPLHCSSVDLNQNENETEESVQKTSASESVTEGVDYVSDTVDTCTFLFSSQFCFVRFFTIALTSLYLRLCFSIINGKSSPYHHSGFSRCCSTRSNNSFKETKGFCFQKLVLPLDEIMQPT